VIDERTIGVVLDAMRQERAAFLELLGGLDAGAWAGPTECPAYDVKGIATHVLGDDLSLLSRQRDGAENGLFQLAAELPGTDFRTLLDTFNDRWVAAARFLSPELLVELLRLAGDWTASYYEAVDPSAPGEPVGFFGATGASPSWQAIAREYLERWVHHSQIRGRSGWGRSPTRRSCASASRSRRRPPTSPLASRAIRTGTGPSAQSCWAPPSRRPTSSPAPTRPTRCERW
jgi:uncharacterized protein (TIGR03083 family)